MQFIAVQSRQNCYHFRDNHRPIIPDAVISSEPAYYGGAWRAFRKRIFTLC